MFGRRNARLLVLWFWAVPLGVLLAQSDRGVSSRDFLIPIQRLRPEPLPGPHPTPVPIRTPESPGVFGFPQLTHAAGTIFSGTVIEVKRHPAKASQTIETVGISFRVENAIRGATPGDQLTITQWIGMWSSGQRYRVGERVLLFLYPPSKLGLTSCAGGALGRFDVDAAGRVSLSAQQLSAFRQDPVIGGKSRAWVSDFALAVRQASEEE